MECLMRVTDHMPAICRLLVAACVGVAFLLCSVSASGGNGKDGLSSICKQVAAIEKDAASYRRVERDLDSEGICTEGACLTAHFKGRSLRKIVARYYGEWGRGVKEYYFAGHSLIFVLSTSYRYDKPIGSPPDGTLSPKVVSVDTDRFYFSGGRLSHWVPPGERHISREPDSAREAEQQLLREARDLRKEAEAGLRLAKKKGSDPFCL